MISETNDLTGEIQKSYTYSPWGERLSQIKHGSSAEQSFYSYNPHTDVEALTDEGGTPVATYGYTAYGKLDEESTTGKDDPRDPNYNPDDPYNVYRFNSKRWDPHTGKVDMGFRDYDPGLNRFLTRDMYNGALEDMQLTLDPWNMNRYAFAGGNPISFVELDGHRYIVADGVDAPSSTGRVSWDYARRDQLETERIKRIQKLEQQGSVLLDGPIYDELTEIFFEDYYTAVTGKDVFTKEEVSAEERGIAAFFSMPWGRIFKGIKWAGTWPGGLLGFDGSRVSSSLKMDLQFFAAKRMEVSLDDLSRAAAVIDRGELTKAGRALQKHGNRPGSVFPKPSGSPADINKAGQEIVDDILTTPGTQIIRRQTGRFGEVIEVWAPDGRGIRYDRNGNFIGFLEPRR